MAMTRLPAAGSRVAVVGASAGGVEALQRFCAGLPEDLATTVIVVVHTPAAGATVLPQILQRRTALECRLARDGDPLAPGVLVAPADHHLLVGREAVELTRTPRVNGTRPAIDPSMRSAADCHGTEAAGIVLSGTRDDGTLGLRAIQRAGGRVAVQDPDDALFPGMPTSALALVRPEAVLSATRLGAWLAEPPGNAPGLPEDARPPVDAGHHHPAGTGTRLTCPDCGGVMFEQTDGTASRFVCSVGHSYSPEAMVVADAQAVEHAMWTAARALQDRITLLEGMAARSAAAGRDVVAEAFLRRARDVREQHELLTALLEREPPAGGAPAVDEAA